MKLYEQEYVSHIELLCDLIVTTVPQFNCTGGVNSDSPTEITSTDIKEVISFLTLKRQEHQDTKDCAVKVMSSFFALCPRVLVGDLKKVYGFIPRDAYSQQEGHACQGISKLEIGCVGNLRFLVTDLALVSTTKSFNEKEVYNVLCFSRDYSARTASTIINLCTTLI